MKNILCYGDSNTWGYDSVNDSRFSWDERYPGILSRKLGPEYHVAENGLCGRTTQYESNKEPFVNGRKGALFCAEVHRPLDFAVIMLGTNDCKAMYHAEVYEIRDGIRNIGRCFAGKGAQVILIAPPVMRNIEESPFFAEFGAGAEEKSDLLKYEYETLSEEEGWLYLDAGEIVTPGRYDRIHVDKEGHRKLAEAIWEMIENREGTKWTKE